MLGDDELQILNAGLPHRGDGYIFEELMNRLVLGDAFKQDALLFQAIHFVQDQQRWSARGLDQIDRLLLSGPG